MGQAKSDEEAIEAARRDLVTYGVRLLTDRLALGTSGNLSVRVCDLIAITPSSISYLETTVEDICVMTLDGEQVAGRAAVSSEWPMHSGIYLATDSTSVVHTHSEELVALSLVRDELPAVHYNIVAFGHTVPVLGYTRFGSDGLASATVAVMQDHNAAILQNHGAVVRGKTLAQTYEHALLLEWLARVYRKSLDYGSPRILSDSELGEVEDEIRRRRYGGLTNAKVQS